MAQFIFGAGNMYVTPLQLADGTSVTNPTPIPLMVLQEGSLDFSGDEKLLYGQNQFPVAVGRGKVKLGVKVKPARVFAAAWNTLFFGQSLSAGLIANHTDTTGVVIPATPFQVTVTPPSSGTFAADMGVISATTGLPMKRVASAPATGEYSVNVSTGAYTFAAADTTKTVYINYQYSASVAGSQKQTVQNLPMGLAPVFKADLTVNYLGKVTTFSFPNAIPTKMGLGFKNEDFAVPEFDFSAFDNGSGQVMTWSTSE